MNTYSGDERWVRHREDSVAFVGTACTGTYLGAVGSAHHLVITAGHCVSFEDEVLVAFNFERDPDGSTWAGLGTVLERSDEPDYALLELPEDPRVLPTPLDREVSEQLAVIQHPLGQPKAIAQGFLSEATGTHIRYRDLDTLSGSSGAGVFNAGGRLVGIHTDGDCDEFGGTNVAWAIEAIVDVSQTLSSFEFDC